MADSRSVKRPIGCGENSGEVDDGGQDAKDETDELKAGNDEPNPKKAREEETNTQKKARGPSGSTDRRPLWLDEDEEEAADVRLFEDYRAAYNAAKGSLEERDRLTQKFRRDVEERIQLRRRSGAEEEPFAMTGSGNLNYDVVNVSAGEESQSLSAESLDAVADTPPQVEPGSIDARIAEENEEKRESDGVLPQNQKSELDLQEERFEEMLEILCRDFHTAQWSPKGVLWVATEDDEPGWAKTKIHKNSDDARNLSWLCSKEGQKFDSNYDERKKAQKSPPR